MRILLVGPLPPPLGGVRLLFEILKDDLLTRKDLEATVIDLSRVKYGSRRGRTQFPLASAFRLLVVLWRIYSEAGRADVLTLHHNLYRMPWLGPWMILVGRIRGKPVFLRIIGGKDFRELPKIPLALLKWSLRKADLVSVETKRVLGALAELGLTGIEWLPNNRPMPAESEPSTGVRKSCRRFLYLGHVRRVKGLPEIIEAGERFAGREDVVVDVYGSLRHDMTEADFAGLAKVRFLGSVDWKELPGLLAKYDVLLLPSYYDGEGYPGIVFDAYAVGMPVICTQWQALPEIVDETSGRLVEPHSAGSLYDAMEELVGDDELFANLRAGVLKKRRQFDSELWNERFVEMCRQVVRRPKN